MIDSVLYHYTHMHIHMYNNCMHTHSDMHIRDTYTCMSCQVKYIYFPCKFCVALEDGSDMEGTQRHSHRCNYEDLVRDYVVS